MNYTEQLERETERTRVQLANTVEELRERLTPGEMLDEVIDYASDGNVGDFLRNFRRQAIDNPVPLGLMGVSVAWLIAASTFGGGRGVRKMSATTGDRVAREAGDFAADARDAGRAFADRAEDMRARAAERASYIAGRASDDTAAIAERASDQVANIADKASDAAERVGKRMRSAASAAGANLAAAGDDLTDSMRSGAKAMSDAATEITRSGRSASRALVDFGREQPLIVAATGIVLGAIIGALLPPTQIEDQLVGETSDAAKDRLREIAGEQYAKVKDVAERTVEGALDESGASDSSSRDRAERRQSREFGPGPGDHPDTQHAGGHQSGGAEEAEHTRAGGG